MGVFDKAKDMYNKLVDVKEEPLDEPWGPEFEPEEEEIHIEPKRKSHRFERSERAETGRDNVVPLEQGSAVGARTRAFGDSQVVVKKIVSVNEVGAIVDILKQNRIVFLNLENATTDSVQRIIDVIYGATYALEGTFRAIAERAFVLTPHNISVSGEEVVDPAENAEE